MKLKIVSKICILFLAAEMMSCSGESMEPFDDDVDGKMSMEFNFSHPSQSRATETSFESGDVVGLFVAPSGQLLEISGNTVSNEGLTFTGSEWKPQRKLYWDAGTYDAYGYYPYADEIGSITDYLFSVKTDQRQVEGNTISGYEESDFLFATAKGLVASAAPVNLQFRHIMSKISIRMIKGENYDGEIPETATVYIHNTVPDASIDLSAGVATKTLRGVSKTITARQEGPALYSAIIVPQRLDRRVPLIEVVMNGVSLLYESRFVFKPGIHHIVSLILDKNPDQIKIEIGGEINNWN